MEEKLDADVTSDAEAAVNTDPETDSVDVNSPWYMDSKFSRFWKHGQIVREHFEKQHAEEKQSQRAAYLNYYQSWYKSMGDYHRQCAEWLQYMETYYKHWLQVASSTGHPAAVWPKTAPFQLSATSPEFKVPFVPREKASRQLSSPDSVHSQRKKKRRHKNASKRENKLPPNVTQVATSVGQTSNLDTSVDKDTSFRDDSFEMEITDEMLDFFALSAKHRKERDADKQEDSTGKKTEDYVDISIAGSSQSKATSLPPTERPGIQRTCEMRQLYGQDAAMIHGMETAMQLTYDHNCDRKQPKLWPHLPLNIQFK